MMRGEIHDAILLKKTGVIGDVKPMIINLLLTVCVASVGSYLFYKLKIPAGALIGAIVFTAAFNIITDLGTFPRIMKTVMQAVAGAFIGLRITRRDIGELKKTLAGGMVMFLFMILYTLGVGYLLRAVTELDLPTALVCAMPAGLSDTSIISADLGANTTQTTIVHTVRTLFAILLLPQLAFQVCKRLTGATDAAHEEVEDVNRIGYKPPEVRTLKNAAITLVLAELFGALGKMSGIPSGALTFAIFGVAVLNIKTSRAYLPKRVKQVAQCIMGTIVGLGVTVEDVRNIPALIKPLLIVLLCTLCCNYICGFLLHKICKLDISTSLFGSIPAGVSDMALIATDLGGDAPKVAVLQLIRYIGLFSVVPLLIKLIAG